MDGGYGAGTGSGQPRAAEKKRPLERNWQANASLGLHCAKSAVVRNALANGPPLSVMKRTTVVFQTAVLLQGSHGPFGDRIFRSVGQFRTGVGGQFIPEFGNNGFGWPRTGFAEGADGFAIDLVSY